MGEVEEGDVDLVANLVRRNEANYRAPRPIKVTFRPHANRAYQSRFRFMVDKGEGFDLVLAGKGTYEENTVPNRPPKIGPRIYDEY